jgi:tetratricopeptide (TPR) repeat protein
MALAVGVAFAPALEGGFVWDDDFYLTDNPSITADGGLADIWTGRGVSSQYFPLTYTFFRLAHRLFGFDPRGYHLVNVLLHLANALLLWRVLAGLGVPGAFWGGVFFALHPVQVETVAWITELKNILSTLLLLTSFLLWRRSREAAARWPGAAYLASLFLFLLALLAKTTALVLPAVALVLAWLGLLESPRRVALSLLPHAVAGLGMGLWTVVWERVVIGARGPAFDIPWLERLLVAGRSWWFYLATLAWPSGLAFSYPRWTVEPGSWTGHLWYLAALAFLLVAVRGHRLLAGACLVHLACLAPLLGFIPLATFQYSYVADHYQYLALAGPLALAAAATQRLPLPPGRRRALAFVLPLALAAVWGLMARRQTLAYGSEERLWRATLAVNPGSWMARNNLGLVLLEGGRAAEAAAEFREALVLKPDHAKAHGNLGLALEALGDDLAAEGAYRRALALDPEDGAAANNLALWLHRRGRVAEAEAVFRQILVTWPRSREARFNYAVLLAGAGRAAEAEAQYRQVLAARPDHLASRVNLAALLASQRRYDEAGLEYDRALALAPEDAGILFDAAMLETSRGDVTRARGLLRRLLRLRPDHPGAGRLAEILGG